MKDFKWFISRYMKRHWLLIVLIFTLGVIVGVVPVLSVQFVKLMLDDVFASKKLDVLASIPIAIVILYAISGISKYVHFSLSRGVGELMVMNLRNDLYSHLLRLPVSAYSKNHSGAMLTKVITDGQKIPKGIMLSMDFIREPVTFLGLLFTAFWANWQLTALILVAAPVVVFLFSKIGSTVKRYANRNLEQYGVLGIILNETFNGLKIIKAFSIEAMMKMRFLHLNKELYRFLFKTYRIEEMSTPLVEFVGSLVTAVVIYVGGLWVIQGKLTQGDFMTILVALGLAQQPIKKINSSNIELQTAIAAIARVRGILNIASEKIHQGLTLKTFNNSIIFNDVHFQYDGDEQYVIKGLNFEIKKGEIVALVGSSGAGKSTIANLLPRFYDVKRGGIFVDSVNINDYTLKSLRDQISMVSQDTFLFNDTVEMNIKCGKKTAIEKDIIAAAKAANAYDFISLLPQGFQTKLGERGLRLSGGEKQRLTIARAIIKNTPILILDEATSSLDSESEQAVQKALNVLMKGRTTLVIAHRLSTIKGANRILVIDEGRIVQEGTHDFLINIEGPYKKFYEKQWG